MSAKREALHFLGLLAFITSAPLIAVAASGHWPRWLIAPFAVMGIAGFWVWVNWILRRARAK